MHYIRNFCVLLLLFWVNKIYAQLPQWASQPVFRNYGMQSGLPADNCFRIQQDHKGKIWVATIHGVSSFNGFTWTNFQQEHELKQRRLPSNWIMDLTTTPENIWFHSDRGTGSISCANPSVKQSKNLHLGWGKLTYFNQKIYSSTWKGIVCYQQKKGKLFYPHLVPKSSNESCIQLSPTTEGIFGVFEDKPGFFFLNKNNQLKRIYPQLFNSKTPLYITQLLVTKKVIFLATAENGIVSYNRKTRSTEVLVDQSLLKGSNVRCMTIYKYRGKSYLLLGTSGNGILVLSMNGKLLTNWKHLPEISGFTLQSDIVQDMFVDKEHGIWVATDKGISYLHPELQSYKPLFLYMFKDHFPSQALINAVSPVSNQQLYIGTDQNGAYYLNYSTGKASLIQSTKDQTIIGLKAINSRDLLIITSHSIQMMNTKTLEPLWKMDVKSSVFGWSISKKGILGLGTATGVQLFDLQKKQCIFNEANFSSPSSELITKSLYFDDTGNIWALRFFNGLYYFHQKTPKKKQLFTDPEIIKRGTDFHNMVLRNKALYISSSEGIFIQQLSGHKRSRHITNSNGLAGNVIDRLILDSEGKIYYTTPTSWCVFDPTKQTSHTIHSIEKNCQKWFNDICEDKQGNIWFTASNYLVRFNPKALFISPQTPKIEEIRVNDQFTLPKQTITLPNEHASLSVQLVDFQFQSNSIVYEYRIPGIQSKWKPLTDGKIVLEGIAPGQYEVEIHTIQLANGKMSKSTSLYFEVEQAFYFKWWFYALLSLILGFAIWRIQRYRFSQKEKIYQTRLQVSRDLHDELGANVSSIQIMANLLENRIHPDEQIHPFVTNISNYSRQINETINDIIWNVNPRNDDTTALMNRIKRFAQLNFDAAGTRLIVTEDIKQEELPIDNITRQFVYFILKEALNNCAKYAQASEVRLTISIDKSHLKIELEDNGIGFDLSRNSSKGNGISNMQRRALEINAQLTIHSAMETGTKLTLTLKR